MSFGSSRYGSRLSLGAESGGGRVAFVGEGEPREIHQRGIAVAEQAGARKRLGRPEDEIDGAAIRWPGAVAFR